MKLYVAWKDIDENLPGGDVVSVGDQLYVARPSGNYGIAVLTPVKAACAIKPACAFVSLQAAIRRRDNDGDYDNVVG